MAAWSTWLLVHLTCTIPKHPLHKNTDEVLPGGKVDNFSSLTSLRVTTEKQTKEDQDLRVTTEKQTIKDHAHHAPVLLLDTIGCKIPFLDPWHSSIRKLWHKRHSNPAACSRVPNLTFLYKGMLYVNQTTRAATLGSIFLKM